MSDHNQVSIYGRLSRDAELKYTNFGTAVLNFSIACNRSIPPRGQGEDWKSEASFFEIQAWGKLAESKNQALVKGKPVLIGGELRQDRWEQDGQPRSKVYIVAESIQTFRDGPGEAHTGSGVANEGNRPANAPKAPRQPTAEEKQGTKALFADGDGFTDDIPF